MWRSCNLCSVLICFFYACLSASPYAAYSQCHNERYDLRAPFSLARANAKSKNPQLSPLDVVYLGQHLAAGSNTLVPPCHVRDVVEATVASMNKEMVREIDTNVSLLTDVEKHSSAKKWLIDHKQEVIPVALHRYYRTRNSVLRHAILDLVIDEDFMQPANDYIHILAFLREQILSSSISIQRSAVRGIVSYMHSPYYGQRVSTWGSLVVRELQFSRIWPPYYQLQCVLFKATRKENAEPTSYDRRFWSTYGDADAALKVLGGGSKRKILPLKEHGIDAQPFIEHAKRIVVRSTKTVNTLPPTFVDEVTTRIADLSDVSTRDDALDWLLSQGKDAAHVMIAGYAEQETATKRDIVNLLNYDNLDKGSLATDALYFTLAQAFASDWRTGVNALSAAGYTIMRRYEEGPAQHKYGPKPRDTIDELKRQEYELAVEETVAFLKRIAKLGELPPYSPFQMTACRMILRYNRLDRKKLIPLTLSKRWGLIQISKEETHKNQTEGKSNNAKDANDDFLENFNTF